MDVIDKLNNCIDNCFLGDPCEQINKLIKLDENFDNKRISNIILNGISIFCNLEYVKFPSTDTDLIIDTYIPIHFVDFLKYNVLTIEISKIKSIDFDVAILDPDLVNIFNLKIDLKKEEEEL